MTGRASYILLLAGLLALVLLAFAASLLIGPAGLGLPASIDALFQGDQGTATLIMREIRLPRALLGLGVGATLGLAGAALQGFLRNPLAEPGVIGISSAAALGAVLALYTGLSMAVPLALPLAAIVFAVIAVLLLQGLTGRGGTLTLILAGIGFASLAGALIALVLNLSPNPFALQEIVFWMLGSLADRSMADVWLALPFMIVGAGLILSLGRKLDVLSLGEDTAVSLGVNLSATRFLLIAGTALGVGAACAVSGIIGFVGLVVPHMLRPYVGHQPSRLLPASALGGALLLLIADCLVRLVIPPVELRLGVVTALIGAPVFLALILKNRTVYR